MGDNKRNWLCLILTVSVLARVGVAFYLGDVVDAPPLLTDQRSYHALAARLLEGHGYSFEEGWYPFTPPDTPTAHWSFLYPLFVAAVYGVFGVHPLAVRVVQAALGGLLLPWMVYRLAHRLFGVSTRDKDREARSKGDLVALGAAAIAAVYGYFIVYAATVMTETLYIVVLLWSLEEGLKLGEWFRGRREVPLGQGVRLGLSLGVAALLRQSVLPWVPVLFLYLLWQAWRARQPKVERNPAGAFRDLFRDLMALAVAGVILMACILPWTYRNYRVYGQFLLLNSNTGYAMYSAQHPMHGTSFREFDAAPVPEGMWGRPEPELDRELMRIAIQFVLDEPGRYLLLSLSRMRAMFEFWPTPDTTLLHNVGRVGSYGVFLPFILYGLYLSLRPRPKPLRSPRALGEDQAWRFGFLYLFMIFYTLLHVLTWAMVRYRLPVDAVSLPFAALALHDLYERGRRWLAARREIGERQITA